MPYPYAELPRKEVEVLGIKTSYIFAGQPEAPLVVLFHGMSASGDIFREIMHELAAEFWLIAPDIPGYGLSDDTEPYTLPHLVEWLASFREALDLPVMMLMGHSFGGALATSFTISYPQDVTRLLLVAPAILAADLFPDFLKRFSISSGLVDLASTLSQSPRLQESQSARPFYDPDAIHESVWQRRSRSFSQSRATGSVLKALAFQDIEPRLPGIRQPVCIIWGKNDPVLPVAHASEIAEALPDARAIVWDQCGHLPFLEKQEVFLAVARSFLRGEEV